MSSMASQITNPTVVYSTFYSGADQRKQKRFALSTFSASLAFVRGIHRSPEFPAQRQVTWSFEVFFDMRLNKRLSKQSQGWWFETFSRPLWRHCDVEQCNGRINSCAIWQKYANDRCCAIGFYLISEPHCSGRRIVVYNKEALTLIRVCCERIKLISIWCEFFLGFFY